MAKIVGNLTELIEDAASLYISKNASTFKSTTPGPQGPTGDRGPEGVGVHHMKGTQTTNSLGDFSVPGYKDTYTFYADADENLPLAWFTVHNGEDSYKNAQDVGYTGTEEEFYTDLAQVSVNAEISSDAVALVEADKEEVEINTALVLGYKNDAVIAKDAAEAAAILAVDSAEIVQVIFLGAKTSDPTVDNQGNPLAIGTMYYNTVSGTLRIWSGTEWSLGAFSVAGAVATFNGRDGIVTLTNQDITDAVGTDLSTVEYGATADQTGAEIQALYEAQPDKVLTDVNMVGLSTDTGLVAGLGQLTWNANETTVDLGLGTATLQVGQEMLVKVRNTSGSTIQEGIVVMSTGSIGNSGRITVAPHTGISSIAKAVIGVTTEPILNGADGFVTAFGKVRHINTTGSTVGETWVDGDVLYIKPNDSGNLTNVVPADSEVYMPTAIVVHAHANGTLFVRVNGVNENAVKVWAINRYETVREW